MKCAVCYNITQTAFLDANRNTLKDREKVKIEQNYWPAYEQNVIS